MRSISATEASELTGLHVETIRGYLRTGRLRADRVGRTYFIDGRELAPLLAFKPRRGRPARTLVETER